MQAVILALSLVNHKPNVLGCLDDFSQTQTLEEPKKSPQVFDPCLLSKCLLSCPF